MMSEDRYARAFGPLGLSVAPTERMGNDARAFVRPTVREAWQEWCRRVRTYPSRMVRPTPTTRLEAYAAFIEAPVIGSVGSVPKHRRACACRLGATPDEIRRTLAHAHALWLQESAGRLLGDGGGRVRREKNRRRSEDVVTFRRARSR